MKCGALLLAICCCAAARAVAWDPVGHMIVCQEAYRHLTPSARAGADAAVAEFNQKNQTAYTFTSAGSWMDDVRAKSREYNTWHYIDLPYTPDGTPLPDAENRNVLWAIRHCLAILSGRVTDPSIDKAQAVVMLAHLVGDVHQPLHTTSRNDAGGNKVKVPNIADPLVEAFPHWRNLHYFWDTAYRRAFAAGKVVPLYPDPPTLKSQPVEGYNAALPLIREQTDALERIHLPEKYPADGNPEDWVTESHRTGYTAGYQELPGGDAANPVELDAAYVDRAREISQQKLVQAGRRLAGLLNGVFP